MSRYRIKNVDTGELKGYIFKESNPELVKADALHLMGNKRLKGSMGNFVVEVETDEDVWKETDVTISNPVLGI